MRGASQSQAQAAPRPASTMIAEIDQDAEARRDAQRLEEGEMVEEEAVGQGRAGAIRAGVPGRAEGDDEGDEGDQEAMPTTWRGAAASRAGRRSRPTSARPPGKRVSSPPCVPVSQRQTWFGQADAQVGDSAPPVGSASRDRALQALLRRAPPVGQGERQDDRQRQRAGDGEAAEEAPGARRAARRPARPAGSPATARAIWKAT